MPPTPSDCSFLSSYASNKYSHGLCVWRKSPSGDDIRSCFCESGYVCGSSPLRDLAAAGITSLGTPKSCEPDPESLLRLIENEVSYIDAATSLMRAERIELEEGFDAVEVSLGRLQRFRDGLLAWHQREAESKAAQASKGSKSGGAKKSKPSKSKGQSGKSKSKAKQKSTKKKRRK